MYLTINEIKSLIFSNFPNEKADIIAKHLSLKCFISNKKLYTLTPTISYDVTVGTTEIENKLLNTVTKLLQQSYNKLEDLEKTEISNIKKWAAVFSNSDVKTYSPQLSQAIVKDYIMDDYYDEMHFANGVYYLAKGTFKPRKIGVHFITYHIDHDYEEPTKKAKNFVKAIVRKTFPLVEDYECIGTILGAALTGRALDDQTMLFLLGPASSGKSNILAMTELAIQKYFVQLKDNTFTANSATADKTFNTFYGHLYIRIAFVNEPKDTKFDVSVFKQFNDGKLQTVKLFKDGSESFEHRAKSIIAANTLPNIIMEPAVMRRLRAYFSRSRFVEKENEYEVDESKGIYLIDKSIIDTLKAKHLQCAWFQILADFAYDWLESREIVYPANFISAKSDIVAANDIMQDFIDSRLIITNKNADRVGKHAMHEAFKLMYPEKHLTPLQLLTSLKEKKIDYNSGWRVHGIQGCFYGITLREDDDMYNEDEEDAAHNSGIDRGEKSVDICKEHAKLKFAYASLIKKYNAKMKSGFGRVDDTDSESESESESKSESESESEDEKPVVKKIVCKVPAKKGFGKIKEKEPLVLAEDATKEEIADCISGLDFLKPKSKK